MFKFCIVNASVFSSILYLFDVDDFEFSYRQICIILVAFIFQVFYYKIFKVKGNAKIALIWYFITIINQLYLIFLIAENVLNGKSIFSLIIGFAYLMIINCFTAFELLESRRVKMKLLIKIGLAIDLIILIASFILENFVYNGFEIYKTVELVSVIAFILLIYSLPMNYATYKIENQIMKNKEICRGINYVNLIIMFIINLMFLILGFSELSRVVFYLIIYATVLLEVLIRVYIFYVKSWNK